VKFTKMNEYDKLTT